MSQIQREITRVSVIDAIAFCAAVIDKIANAELNCVFSAAYKIIIQRRDRIPRKSGYFEWNDSYKSEEIITGC